MTFSYVVRTAVESPRAFDAYVAWLRVTHVADVCDAGASDAELVLIDVGPGEPRVVEVRYVFASREAFDAYLKNHAPRLRLDGMQELARLGLGSGHGVVFTRTTGEKVPWQRPSSPPPPL
ncbi:MAG: DUF4286 family protein [Labilithrix sp.]|nr:DUF4286 family protein [Labilithrix sp.]